MSNVPPAYPQPINFNVDPSGMVIIDAPCRKCAYNLRGLSVDGRCPECGTPVGLSVHGDLLRFSNPQWVRKLQRGCMLILAGIGVIVLGVILMIAVSMAIPQAAMFLQVIVVGGNILTLIGSWLLTEPDPSGLGEDKYGTSRKIIRISLIVGVVSSLLSFVQQTGSVAPEMNRVIAVVGGIAGLIGVIGQFAQLNYLSKLALRIPDSILAERARKIMWGIGISYAVFLFFTIGMAIMASTGGPPAGGRAGGFAGVACVMMIVAIVLIVYGIRYLFLLDKLRRRFGDEAAVAESSWAGTATA